MSKHTPGPWSSFYKNKYDEWHVSLPISGSSMKLALCPDGIQSENREADARLIAAAPDMLEALQRLVTEAKLDGKDKRAGWDCWVSMAEDAIAKAEGRQ